MKKTLIIGSQGIVGRAFQRANPDAVGTHYRPLPGVQLLNLLDPQLDHLSVKWEEYEYGLIASAIAKIGVCELDKEQSRAINVEGALSVAKQLLQRGVVPIFFSTDYVFDGKSGGYDETSSLSPLNEYGRQKAILEQSIPSVCGTEYLLIRLGKVFTLNPEDRSLFDEMVGLLKEGKTVRAAHDQIFNPILIDDVVKCVQSLQEKKCRGCYQVCGNETWSRYQLALEIARQMNTDPTRIEKISLDDLNEPFLRPKNTSLSNRRVLQELNLKMTPILPCIAQTVLQGNL